MATKSQRFPVQEVHVSNIEIIQESLHFDDSDDELEEEEDEDSLKLERVSGSLFESEASCSGSTCIEH